MEKEPIQKSNIKFNFKREFLIKFAVFAIISVLMTVITIISLNEDEASVGEIFGMFFTLISFSAIVALVINYFHKWIWEFQHREKVEKSPVWKKWWFWLIIIAIIVTGSIIISNHVAKVNDCKKRCTYEITQQGEGVWSYWKYWKDFPTITIDFSTKGYSTREECIEGCILNTDWEKVKY
ncbi:MAG TPA: hypothetical protein PLL80_00940 [Candidatus Pacearchaeota archaeon]|nr:hypothetical protein [Candidatus Pacearchaeota archaeon]HOL83538.1 hypothetical protein [Caldisericia bacterium]HPO75162.1 hypothetical protein [Candidatus Pacearchaeota archaeon]